MHVSIHLSSQKMSTGKDLSEGMDFYCYYHNLLNHICVACMHPVSKKRKLLKMLISMHSTQPAYHAFFVKRIENRGDLKVSIDMPEEKIENEEKNVLWIRKLCHLQD